jgi:putative FmdB family regulatory protein
MPTYEYACTECGEHTEAVQSFTDDPLSVCPHCGGPLRKVFGAPGIVLKGSGFYKTDSRSSAGAKRPASVGTSSDSGGAGSGSGSGSDGGSSTNGTGGSDGGSASAPTNGDAKKSDPATPKPSGSPSTTSAKP